jgi:lipoprotein Spr
MNHKGTDCSGFSLNLYKEVYKLDIPRSSEDQYKKSRHVRRRRLKEGQLVFFHIEKGKKVSHVGVYLGNHKFVHASTKKGVRIDDLRDKYYAKAFVCGGKFRKTVLSH